MIDRRGPAVAARRVPRCRRRCICWPACSTGTRSAGATGCRCCGWRRRCGWRGASCGRARRAIAASPGETVENWLIRNGQTAGCARCCGTRWRWPRSISRRRWRPRRCSRACWPRCSARDPRAAAIALPTTAAARDVRRAGARVHRAPRRDGADRRAGTVRVEDGARRGVSTRPASAGSAGVVISAVPWFALGDLFDGDAAAARGDCSTRARAMASSPIVTVNLWFDRPVLDEPFVGLPGRAMQWVFDKRAVFGDRRVASVARVERRVAARRADQRRAHRRRARRSCSRRCPASGRRGCCARRSSASRGRRFRWRPGSRRGPDTQTPVRGLFLAGDWIDTGLPATIESAVRSGHTRGGRCASAVMTIRFMTSDRRSLQGAGAQGAEPPVVHPDPRPQSADRAGRASTSRSIRSVMGRIEIELGPRRVMARGARARSAVSSASPTFRIAGRGAARLRRAGGGDPRRPRRPAARVVPRVSARRADKRFPFTSPQIEREVGGLIKEAKGWRVDLDDAGADDPPRDAAGPRVLFLRQGAGRRRAADRHRRARGVPAVGRHRLAGGGVPDDAARLLGAARSTFTAIRSCRARRRRRCARSPRC